MTRFDRYLLASFTRLLLLTVCAFIGLYLLIDFFEKIGDLLDSTLSIGQQVLFFAAKTPLILQQVLPLATLMAVFLTLGQLSRSSELTAMRAAGISLGRIAAPLLFSGLLLGAVTFLVSEYVTPISSLKTATLWQQTRKSPTHLTTQDLWLRTADGILYIRDSFPQNARLEGVSFFQLDDAFRIQQRIDADEAVYTAQRWQWLGTRGYTFGEDGTARVLADVPQELAQLDRRPMDFQPDRDEDVHLSFSTLWQKQQRQVREGLPSRRMTVEIHARLAAPFACLVMAFLGIPFALQTGRKSGLAMGLAISVFAGVIYFVLNAVLLATGYAGQLQPVVAAWCTNLLFLLFGLWLLLMVRQ